MAVSTCSPHRPAKATRVSIRRKKTRTKASPVSTPHGHDQAQARAVSRERSATPTPSHMPTPQKTRTQFDWVKFQRSLKTLQFQRCELMVRKSRRGIACEIGELSSDVHESCMRSLWDRGGARLRGPWAAAGPGRLRGAAPGNTSAHPPHRCGGRRRDRRARAGFEARRRTK